MDCQKDVRIKIPDRFSKVDFHIRVHAVAKVQYLITKNIMHRHDTSTLPEWCTNKRN